MVCYISCGIALGFIVASLMCMLTKSEKFHKLLDSLDEKERKAVNNIVKERVMLYVKGTILGLIFAILFVLWANDKFSRYTTLCTFIIIMFVVQIGVYMFTPKKDYILKHMKTGAQTELWLNVYNEMKNKYHFGFLGGLIGYGALCYAFMNR
jgi:uncharacterized protein YacL